MARVEEAAKVGQMMTVPMLPFAASLGEHADGPGQWDSSVKGFGNHFGLCGGSLSLWRQNSSFASVPFATRLLETLCLEKNHWRTAERDSVEVLPWNLGFGLSLSVVKSL